MTTLDPREELVSEYNAAKSGGNMKLAMDILMRIAKIDKLDGAPAADSEPDQDPESFATQQAVVRYLVDKGWKANDSTLSLHVKDRKLVPGPDGTFSLEDVEAYAVNNLVNNPQRAEKNSIDELNLEAKQLENRRQRMKLEQLEGTLVNADDVRRELENMLTTFRSRILIIPRKLAHQLAQVSDQHQVESILTRELRDTLTTLSQYHVEPTGETAE